MQHEANVSMLSLIDINLQYLPLQNALAQFTAFKDAQKERFACPICLRLAIKPRVWVFDAVSSGSLIDKYHTRTLCGHIFCGECLTLARDQALQDGSLVQCAVCQHYITIVPRPCFPLQAHIDALNEGSSNTERRPFVWRYSRPGRPLVTLWSDPHSCYLVIVATGVIVWCLQRRTSMRSYPRSKGNLRQQESQ